MSDKKMWSKGLGFAVKDYRRYKGMGMSQDMLRYYRGRIMGYLGAGMWVGFIDIPEHKRATNSILEIKR